MTSMIIMRVHIYPSSLDFNYNSKRLHASVTIWKRLHAGVTILKDYVLV